jgi:hypothetical protein
MRIRNPGWRQFGSGIRDGKKLDPGYTSRIRNTVKNSEYFNAKNKRKKGCILFTKRMNPEHLAAVLRIRDVYPGSRILIFTHPGSRIQKQEQKRGVKKFVVKPGTVPFFIATNFTKIWVWDPGVKKTPDPGSGSATLLGRMNYTLDLGPE